MGFPSGTLTDIIKNSNVIEKQLNPTAFSFIVYKKEHASFRNFVLTQFNEIHNMSREVVFFVLDNPPDWNERSDNSYYWQIAGSDAKPELKDEEVDLVLEKFGIHPSLLPAVIVFKNFNSRSWLVLSLKEIKETNYTTFFRNLFESLSENCNNWFRPDDGKVILSSTEIEKFSPEFMVKNGGNLNVVVKSKKKSVLDIFMVLASLLNKFLKQIAFLQRDIEKLRRTFKKKAEYILNQNEENEDGDFEKIRAKIDSQLISSCEKIAAVENIQIIDCTEKYQYLEYFEKDSKVLINTCLTTKELYNKYSRAFEDTGLTNFDYSVCTAGFWKALEIELTIILVDVLRFIQNCIDKIPAPEVPDSTIETKVKAKRNGGFIYELDLANCRHGKFCDILFNDMINLLRNWNYNQYDLFVTNTLRYNKSDWQCIEFMSDYCKKITELISNYRNDGSHRKVLDKEAYEKVCELVFSKNGLFEKVVPFKKNLKQFLGSKEVIEHRQKKRANGFSGQLSRNN